MGGFRSYFTLFAVFTVSIILFSEMDQVAGSPGGRGCACSIRWDSATPGCIISVPAAYSGFKCRCRPGILSFLFPSCVGGLIPCSEGEKCPAGCASKECCLLGGGDCNGYDAATAARADIDIKHV